MPKKAKRPGGNLEVHYDSILGDISHVIDAARKSAARSVNCIMTAAYWLIGRRIVESEQKGEKRAAYGTELLERLSNDLGKRYGNGFSRQNLQQMRQFYLLYRPEQINQTPSGEIREQPNNKDLPDTVRHFADGLCRIFFLQLRLKIPASLVGLCPSPVG